MSTNATVIKDFTQASGNLMNDPGSLAAVARSTAETGYFQPTPWPPGMVSIEAALYRLSPNAPVGLVLIVLTALVWATALASTAEAMATQGAPFLVAAALQAVFLFTPELRSFFSFGIFNAEPLAIGLALLGFGLLSCAFFRLSLALAMAAGVALAGAAYVREQIDLVMWVALALLIAGFGASVLSRQRWRWVMVAAVALGSYHAVTLPYRAANHWHWGQTESNMLWPIVWETKSELVPALSYMAQTGATAGCTVDPGRCAAIHATVRKRGGIDFPDSYYFHQKIASYLRRPVAWVRFKLPYIVAGWETGGVWPEIYFWALAFAAVTLALQGSAALFSLAAVFIGVVGPLLVIHTEVRFLYLIKLAALQHALFSTALLWRRSRAAMGTIRAGSRRQGAD